MSASDDSNPHASPTTKALAEALARKKAAGGGGPASGRGKLHNERDAAARSTAKSKPPMRK